MRCLTCDLFGRLVPAFPPLPSAFTILGGEGTGAWPARAAAMEGARSKMFREFRWRPVAGRTVWRQDKVIRAWWEEQATMRQGRRRRVSVPRGIAGWVPGMAQSNAPHVTAVPAMVRGDVSSGGGATPVVEVARRTTRWPALMIQSARGVVRHDARSACAMCRCSPSVERHSIGAPCHGLTNGEHGHRGGHRAPVRGRR